MDESTPKDPKIDDLDFVYLELTVKCNLRCHFCDNSMRNLYRDVPVDRFHFIIDQLKPGARLGLHGLGEPALHKNLVELIGYAKQRGLYVYFNSNHTVTTDDQMRGFVDSGLDELRISMSAGTAESFKAYAGRDLYDKLIERTRRMVEIRGTAKTPLLRAVFVLTTQSYKEFSKVLDFAQEVGLDELQVQTFLNWGKTRLPDEPEGGCALEDEELDRARRAVVETAKRATGIRVILPFPMDPEDPAWHDQGSSGRCQWPFNATWITADGHVTPCCNLHDPRQINFGSAFDQSLEQIWLNEAYQEFRGQYRADSVEWCRECPVHYGRFKSYTYERKPT